MHRQNCKFQTGSTGSSFPFIVGNIPSANIKKISKNADVYMGQFAQFGLNEFKRGQTHFSQLHISLDPDKLESCLCSLITVMHGFAKVTCMGCDH